MSPWAQRRKFDAFERTTWRTWYICPRWFVLRKAICWRRLEVVFIINVIKNWRNHGGEWDSTRGNWDFGVTCCFATARLVLAPDRCWHAAWRCRYHRETCRRCRRFVVPKTDRFKKRVFGGCWGDVTLKSSCRPRCRWCGICIAWWYARTRKVIGLGYPYWYLRSRWLIEMTQDAGSPFTGCRRGGYIGWRLRCGEGERWLTEGARVLGGHACICYWGWSSTRARGTGREEW